MARFRLPFFRNPPVQKGDGEVSSTDEARQGPKGTPVLYVLIASLSLCALFIIGSVIWGFQASPQ